MCANECEQANISVVNRGRLNFQRVDGQVQAIKITDYCDTCFRLLRNYPVTTCEASGVACKKCSGPARRQPCKREVCR